MIINKFEEKLFSLIEEIDKGNIKRINKIEGMGNCVYSYKDFVCDNSFEYYLLNDCDIYGKYFEENGNVSYYIESEDLEINCPFVYCFLSNGFGLNEQQVIWIDNTEDDTRELVLNYQFEKGIRVAKAIYDENKKLKSLISSSENETKRRRI